MRVITGIAKGRKLETLVGNDVRPTTDMVKEAIFSSIQFDITGCLFLDLFAGSGQMGIEAISRGAANCVFTESNPEAITVIKKNLDKTGFSDKAEVIKTDCFYFLKTTSKKFDIAFLDPPYKLNLLSTALENVSKVMNTNGIIICEHPLDVVLPQKINGFSLKKSRKYGKINISIYRKDSEEE